MDEEDWEMDPQGAGRWNDRGVVGNVVDLVFGGVREAMVAPDKVEKAWTIVRGLVLVAVFVDHNAANWSMVVILISTLIHTPCSVLFPFLQY